MKIFNASNITFAKTAINDILKIINIKKYMK